jgi:hypothetical protein
VAAADDHHVRVLLPRSLSQSDGDIAATNEQLGPKTRSIHEESELGLGASN